MATRSLPPRLRWSILERDRFACVYCGRGTPDGIKLAVDHVIPWSAGGTDDPTNLVTACEDCNTGKSNRMPVMSKHAADALEGASCPTRLRIAAIAELQDVDYRYLLKQTQEMLGEYAPPHDRYDRRWMAVVRADRDRFLRAVIRRLDASVNRQPQEPFA